MDLPCEIDQFEIHVSCFWVDTCIEFVKCKRKVVPLLFKAVCSIQSDFGNVSLQESLHLAVQTLVHNSILFVGLKFSCTAKEFLGLGHWLLIDFNVIRNCVQKFVLIATCICIYIIAVSTWYFFTGWLLWGLVKPQKLKMCYYLNWNQLITIGSDVKKLQKGNVTF